MIIPLLLALAPLAQVESFPEASSPNSLIRLGSRAVFRAGPVAGIRPVLRLDEDASQAVVVAGEGTLGQQSGVFDVGWRDRYVYFDPSFGPVSTDGGSLLEPVWAPGTTAAGVLRKLVATPANLFVFQEPTGTGVTRLTLSPGIGTATETVDLPHSGPMAESVAVFGNRVFFVLDDPDVAIAGAGVPWVSEGTAAGTYRLQGVGAPFFFGLSVAPVTDGERVWFEGQTGAHGRELWVTDGTQAGTQLLADAVPGPGSSFPDALVLFGDRLAFRARIGGVEQAWSVPAGGGVATPLPGLPQPARPLPFVGHGAAIPELCFVEDLTPGASNVLWASDGTLAGTVQLTTSAPLTDVQPPLVEVASDGTVLFGGRTDAHGLELFRSASDASGLALVVDLVPGSGSSAPSNVVPAGPRIYFRADDAGGSQLRAISAAELGLASIQAVGQACDTAARLSGVGDPTLGGTVQLALTEGAPGALAAICFGLEILPFGSGAPCGLRIDLRALLGVTSLDGAGEGALSVGIPADPSLAGRVVRLQNFEGQPGGPVLGSFAGSNVLELVLGS